MVQIGMKIRAAAAAVALTGIPFGLSMPSLDSSAAGAPAPKAEPIDDALRARVSEPRRPLSDKQREQLFAAEKALFERDHGRLRDFVAPRLGDPDAGEKSALLAEFSEDLRRLGLTVNLSEDAGSLSISSKPVGFAWHEMRIEADGKVSSLYHDFPKGAVPANDATVAAALAKDALHTLAANDFHFNPWLVKGPLYTQWKNSLAQDKHTAPYDELVKALEGGNSSLVHLSHDFCWYSALVVTPQNENATSIRLKKPKDIGIPVFATDEFTGTAFKSPEVVNLYFDKGRTDVFVYRTGLRVFFSDAGTIAMSPNDRSAYHRDPVTKFESLHMRVEPDISGKVSATAPNGTHIGAIFEKDVTRSARITAADGSTFVFDPSSKAAVTVTSKGETTRYALSEADVTKGEDGLEIFKFSKLGLGFSRTAEEGIRSVSLPGAAGEIWFKNRPDDQVSGFPAIVFGKGVTGGQAIDAKYAPVSFTFFERE